MKIIKHGNGFKLKPKKKIKCRCGCKYIATDKDTYLSQTVLGNGAYYANCPECGFANYYQDK